MRFRPRTWLLFSLLLFAGAYWFWTYGNKVNASRRAHAALPLPAAVSHPPKPALAKIAVAPKAAQAKSYRLTNTRLTEKQLLRSNHAIILRNALIDTDRPLKLDIPAHLRAKGAPGSYIVQSEESLGPQRFSDLLKKDGVTFVAYIPNNAALVQATPEQARQMASDAEFQAVLPYEPYYKLATSLLPSAVAQEQPLSEALNVTALPGQRDAALAALQGLGAQLMGEDTGPFGTTLSVMVPPEKLVAVAQLPLAQEIEPYAPRRVLNDLSRVALGISANTLYTTSNYMNLTGLNVTVNMNDTGVDSTHPDFAGPGGTGTTRLKGALSALTDQINGHGTHVAGIIMGNGSKSSTINSATNPIPGSVTGAGFQGKATNATLFVQSLDLVFGTGTTNELPTADAFQEGGSLLSDAALQTNASVNLGPTNLISNNSWGYAPPFNEIFPPPPYDMHAASFDQATRDAQPSKSGEQPMLFVFAAGGSGNSPDDFGNSGAANSIYSPATAKNVITVGALDEARYITNDVDFDGQTNDIFFDWTDNDVLVSWFSSCGNVARGIEGAYGRFKPDVVAPGVFTISCRASNYVDPIYDVTLTTYPYPNQQVLPGQTNYFGLAIPVDTAGLVITVTPNPNSPEPFPNLDILADPKTPPTTVRSASNFLVLSNQLTVGQWYFGVTTQGGQKQPVAYDLTMYLLETNDFGVATTNTNGYFNVISNLNSVLKPYYMYQSGTSMSAGAVSGMLALMQEFLQTKMAMTNPSPALLKAMLINGSRSVEEQYDFNPQATGPNEQGWGLPNLPNSLPASLTTANPSMVLINQSTNDALATGQSQSYTVNCADGNATNFPLRVTLVWTDPPGDPTAGIALVNNLDLLVTSSDGATNEIWLGNDFFGGDIFTEVNTGDLPDVINNVQNVYIDSGNTPFQFPLTVTVLGMRVNVNAATTETNLIAQDYALVISSDDTALASPLTVISNKPSFTPPAQLAALTGPQFTNAAGAPLLAAPLLSFAQSNYGLVTVISNGVNYLHQRVGANEPNLYTNGVLYTNGFSSTLAPLGTNGNPFQWHFFIYTNNQFVITNGTNIQATNFMVTTFMPPDLATQISPRTNGADLDLYVSTNSELTNLDATVFADMTTNDMSLGRGGDETVIYSNSQPGEVYYIGVKSEDQQAADFGIYAVAQQQPFSTVNPDGSVSATAGPVAIPDSLELPPAILHLHLQPSPLGPMVRKVTATLSIAEGNPGDLYGTLTGPTGVPVVLNNYSGPPGGFTNTYNDLDDNTVAGSVNSDGPGSLKNYVNTTGAGDWMLTESDNALLQEGQINSLTVTAFPQPPQSGFLETLCGQQWFFDYVVVPDDATNMTISITYVSGSSQLGVFITNVDDVVTTDDGVILNAPGGLLTYSITNQPPLAGGLWYYGIFNYGASDSDAACDTFEVQVSFGLSQVPNLVQTFTNNTLIPLPIDATTNASQICISNGQQVVDLSVGVRLADTNLDDLALQLTSPQGTSIVLFQNRGGLLATNLGLTLSNSAPATNTLPPNYVYTVFTEDTNLADVPIKFAPPPYAVPTVIPQILLSSSSFDSFTNLEDFYTNGIVTSNAAGNYTNGQTVAGWFVETNLLVTNSVVTNIVTGPTNAPVTNQMAILVTNQVFNEVSVVTDPSVTYDGTNVVGTNTLGSNYLALASGRLSQTFTTIPGAAYEFIYYARSPGLTDWWPADDNLIDLVGTNTATIPYHDVTFDAGEVDRAFTFSGVVPNPAVGYVGNEVDFGTNTANFGTNDFTVDFWIKQSPTNTDEQACLEKRVECGPALAFWEIQIGGPVGWGNVPPGHLKSYIQPNGGANPAELISSNTINDGNFHHVALIRKGATYSYYIDGFPDSSNTPAGTIANLNNIAMFRAGQSVCISPGADGSSPDSTQPFDGSLDELDVWQRALSPAEIHAIYMVGNLGKYNTNSLYPNFQVNFDGISSNTLIIPNFAETNWQLYTNSFIATSNQTTIELLGNSLGVLLDDVQLVQLSYTNYNNYYLPEEPLTPLIGQNPQGCWTLSVWDTRTDSTLTNNGSLLSWTLQVTTSSTNVNLIVLTSLPNNTYSTASVPTNLPPGGIFYFGVDVPDTANFATNILSSASGPMNLFFNQYALPTGALPGDVTLVSITNAGGGAGSHTLSTFGAPPPLLPGQRYFLGVQNTSTAAETFNIQVNFDVGSDTNITTLNPTNGIAVLDPKITNQPAFYSFTVPTNAVLVTFQLLGVTNGEADLYASAGLPVPGPLNFDYESRNEGASDQFIAITTNSQPVPLPTFNTNDVLPMTPTMWYLSVYNAGTNVVGYTIQASYATNGPNGTVGAINVISLNTRSNYTYYETNAPGAPPGFPTSQLYSFAIPATSLGEVQFTVTNISINGNLQLLVGKDAFPTPEDSYAGSFNAGNSNQLVVIVTNSGLPSLDATWYLAVPNTSTNNVKYSITAAINGVLTQPLTWDGKGGSTWNFTEADWRPAGSLTDITYNDTDAVTFDDTLTTGHNIITVPTNVQPGSVTFNNSASNTYRFTGSGGISGTTGLNVQSNGTVILDNSGGNTFSGPITIADGLLQIGNNDANGSITANVTNIAPGKLVFNRTDNLAYVGNISGNGTLVKNNTDILTLTDENPNLAGVVDILAGTLRLGAPNALGSGSNAPILISSGGTLDLNSVSGTALVTVAGAGAGNDGAIVNNGFSPAMPGLSYMVMDGDTTIGGLARWDLDSPAGAGSDTAPTNASFLSTGGHAYNLTKVGPNFIGLISSAVDPALANIDVKAGTLDYEGATDSLGNPTSVLTIETNATLELYNATNALNKVIVFQDGSTNFNAAGSNSLVGPITLSTNDAGDPGTVTFNIGGTSQWISQTISGPGNLIVTGGQPLYLSASNTYTGSTLVTAGTVFLINTGSIGLSANVTGASNATLDVTGRADMTYTVPGNQTLQGFDNINGLLNVAPGGTVAPGETNFTDVLIVSSNVSLAGTAFFKADNTEGGTNDVLESLGASITYGGTLAVSNMNPTIPYTNGQSFQLFSDPSSIYLGSFTNIMPFQPAIGLYWNTNLLGSTGTLSVTNLPVAPALIWDGGAGPNWNFTEADWRSAFGPPDTTFTDADPVTFDDSLTSGRNTINIPANVQPGNMTFSNSMTNTYTFVGSGSIAGITGLNLESNGTVILDNSGGNTFIGLVAITNGALQIGKNDTNGSMTASVTNTAPGKLIFDRSDNLAYGGVLSGNGSLVQNDTNILTITGNNTNLQGLVAILQGTLRLGATNALGSGSNAPVFINSGATLDLNSTPGTNFVTVAGVGVGSQGAIVNNGFGPAIPGLAYITMIGDATFGGLETWDLGNQAISNAVMQPTNDSYLSTGGHPYNLTKVGTNVIGLVSTDVDPALANIDIKAGTLAYEGTTESLGNPTNILTIETGATLEFDNTTNALNKVLVFKDGSTNLNAGGSNIIAGPVTLSTNAAGGPGTVTFNMAADRQLLSGAISGSGNLIVMGGQLLFLTATNTYTGFTLVSSGTVFLLAEGSIGLSSNVTIASNAIIDVTIRTDTTYTIPSNQTLQGFGSIYGSLAVSAGATFAPGASNATGVFTVSSNVTLAGTAFFKINNAVGGANDVLVSSGGSIIYGGTLQVSNIAPTAYSAGQSFQLFRAAEGYAGSFANIVPALPGVGLHWNTNLLASNGTLSVAADMPDFASFSISGTNLLLNITNGIPGGQFIILTSTNLTQPWTPFATNTFNSSGDSLYDATFSPTNQQQFFIIQQP